MLIVIDQRAPKEAKSNLSQFGKLVEFNTHGIVYPAISGHPDIFICQTPSCLIIAPSIPKIYTDLLKLNNIAFEYGNSIVGSKFPETSYYNCVTNGHYLFHKKGFTDKEILLRNESLELIEMPQAYTRCNLIEISKDTFITSDRGIEKNLLKNAFKAHYFSPEDIF